MEENTTPTQVESSAFAPGRRLRPRRGRHPVFLALSLVATGSLLYFGLTSPPPSISVESYERIAEGLTEGEVHRIVGARPGGYGTSVDPHTCLVAEWAETERHVRWGNRFGILSVGFGRDGRVSSKRLEYNPNATPEWPELWSWWRRQMNRSTPTPEPSFVFISY